MIFVLLPCLQINQVVLHVVQQKYFSLFVIGHIKRLLTTQSDSNRGGRSVSVLITTLRVPGHENTRPGFYVRWISRRSISPSQSLSLHVSPDCRCVDVPRVTNTPPLPAFRLNMSSEWPKQSLTAKQRLPGCFWRASVVHM